VLYSIVQTIGCFFGAMFTFVLYYGEFLDQFFVGEEICAEKLVWGKCAENFKLCNNDFSNYSRTSK
jgi:glycerol uptake facilitator-like aquaporin